MIVAWLIFTAWLPPFQDFYFGDNGNCIVFYLSFVIFSLLNDIIDKSYVDDEEILCIIAQWLLIFIDGDCVWFSRNNSLNLVFAENDDLVKIWWRCCYKRQYGDIMITSAISSCFCLFGVIHIWCSVRQLLIIHYPDGGWCYDMWSICVLVLGVGCINWKICHFVSSSLF